MSELPEITEVERLTLKPGDILFLHVDEKLTPQVAEMLKDRFVAFLGGTDVKVAVLDKGMTVKVGDRETP